MTQPQAEMLDLYRAGLKTAADLMKVSLQSAEKLQNQQLVAIRTALDLLLDEESTGLLNLQEFIGKPVHLQVDGLYNQEQFDVVLM